MAVYTDISHPRYSEQLSKVEEAYGLSITSLEGITLGSSDSMFMVGTREYDNHLVLTIHETPDVTPAGLTSESAQRLLHYVDFLARESRTIRDRNGEAVGLTILKPLEAYPQCRKKAPFLELKFDGVRKIASIVPFVRGKSYANSPEEIAEPNEAYQAGRALGAYITLAQSYPEPQLFSEFDFNQYLQEVVRIAEDKSAMEKLGFVLSGHLQEGTSAEKIGLEYMSEMKTSGRQLLDSWRRLPEDTSGFPCTVIHGDMFTDNVLFDDDGRFILLDFNEIEYGFVGIDIGVALCSWASQNGIPVRENILRLLEGFDSVTAFTGNQLSQIPTFTQVGSYHWETFRVQRIEMQDPRQRSLRSPAEFQSIRQGWKAMQHLFEEIQSVRELAVRLDYRDPPGG